MADKVNKERSRDADLDKETDIELSGLEDVDLDQPSGKGGTTDGKKRKPDNPTKTAV